MNIKTLIILLLLGCSACHGQTGSSMNTPANPLLCDPEKGACEINPDSSSSASDLPVSGKKPVKIIYFTDPICSSCWGIEPQLRKLKLEYGADVEVEYHMGGLLPDWNYNSGGISKPSDVAGHWDEVSRYYQMPIDGDVWLEDPLPSSYPPSIAFKAAQLQNGQKALTFLRVLREMVFLQKKNITRWEYIRQAAIQAGLDTAQLKKDYDGRATTLFHEDLALARRMGVRGFPSVFVTDSIGNREFVYGFKPYAAYESSILKLYPQARKAAYATGWKSLFSFYPTLTQREFAELSGVSMQEAEALLNRLIAEGSLTKLTTKNGSLWARK